MKYSNYFFTSFTIIFLACFLSNIQLNAQPPIKIFKDTFKDMKTAFCCISVRAKSEIKQVGRFDDSFHTSFLFYKKIKDGVSKIEMRMHITSGVLQNVEKEIFLQTDTGRTKLSSQKTRDAFFQEEETISPSDDSETTKYLFYSQKKLEYTYLIPEEIVKEFLETNNILFRIYVDDVPFDLDFTLPEVRELKSFFLVG